jgi:hypothetical protein
VDKCEEAVVVFAKKKPLPYHIILPRFLWRSFTYPPSPLTFVVRDQEECRNCVDSSTPDWHARHQAPNNASKPNSVHDQSPLQYTTALVCPPSVWIWKLSDLQLGRTFYNNDISSAFHPVPSIAFCILHGSRVAAVFGPLLVIQMRGCTFGAGNSPGIFRHMANFVLICHYRFRGARSRSDNLQLPTPNGSCCILVQAT